MFGHTFWAGWLMFAAVVYSGVPGVFPCRIKLKLAPQIRDKILYADAQMMKADWMAESATAIGVLGVGLGLWWLDPVAAAAVSASIIKDGAANVLVATRDLMEHRPTKIDRSGPESLPQDLEAFFNGLDWVESASVRLREGDDLPAKISSATTVAKAINWRLHDLTVTITPWFEHEPAWAGCGWNPNRNTD